MRALLIISALTLVLGAAACSGSEDVADVESTDAAAADAGDAAADTAAEPTGAEEPADAAADASAGFAAGDCDEASAAFTGLGQALASAASGQADPAEIEAQVATFSDLSASVPAEVQGDFEVLASAYGDLATALAETAPGTPPDAAALAGLSAPEITTASTNVANFFAGGCQ